MKFDKSRLYRLNDGLGIHVFVIVLFYSIVCLVESFKSAVEGLIKDIYCQQLYTGFVSPWLLWTWL